jgi:hypothetical protein
MSQFKLIAAAAALFAGLGVASVYAQTSPGGAPSQPSAPTTTAPTTDTPSQQPDQGTAQSDPSAAQQPAPDSTSQQPQQGQDSSTSQPH